MKNKTIKNILTYYKAKKLTKTILRYNNKLEKKSKLKCQEYINA